MTNTNIYKDIATRTGGDIYIGVVGPVRSGKSTFIKRFMNNLVIPNIQNESLRERANDELPQSAAGRTIMTTEPKFVPEKAAEISLNGVSNLKVRLIDCVGYIVPSSIGYIEDENPRMVMTPWYDEPIPFNMAAEYGTKKVITEHSTIGLVITTDGSISDIPREEYMDAENRVISELKEIDKPFIVLLNSMYPDSEHAKMCAEEISKKHNISVKCVNLMEMNENDIKEIMLGILYEFPIKEMRIALPKWINCLKNEHWLRKCLNDSAVKTSPSIVKMRDADLMCTAFSECESVKYSKIDKIDFGDGSVKIMVDIDKSLFYEVLNETIDMDIHTDKQLMECMIELAEMKKDYMKFKNALDEVNATGYGIVMPTIEELTLKEPEIVKQGGRYGVILQASAPSIHIESPKQMHNIFKAKFAQKHGFKGELQHYADSLKAAC